MILITYHPSTFTVPGAPTITILIIITRRIRCVTHYARSGVTISARAAAARSSRSATAVGRREKVGVIDYATRRMT